MKIGDYIKEKLGLWSVEMPTEMITAELSKIGILSDDEVTEKTNLDLFFYNIIPDIMLRPNSVSEGGYSVSFDKNALQNYYNSLCNKLGKDNILEGQKNTIKDITKQW